MNKIKEINIIFAYRDHHDNVELYLIDRIYNRCTLKDVGIIKKFWNCFWRCNCIIWDLYPIDENHNKFLYL